MIPLLTAMGPLVVFSDGSWQKSGSPWRHVLGNIPEFNGFIGLIFMSASEEWKDLPIYSLRILNGEGLQANSAYSMELFGILVAAAILAQCPGSSIILSDCEAAVKSLHSVIKGSKRLKATTRDIAMLTSAAGLLNEHGNMVSWTKGHPERTEPDADNWTKEMWGNHLSDRAAAGMFTGDMDYQYDGLYSNLLAIRSFPDLDAPSTSKQVAPSQGWFFGSSSGQMVSTSIVEAVAAQRLNKYIQSRDQDRRNRNLPPKWCTYNIPLAATLW
jgi:hypothetical protein